MSNPSIEPTNVPVAATSPATEQLTARLRDFQLAAHERRGGGRSKRRWLWLLLLAVLACAGLAGYSYRTANALPEAEVFVYTGKPSKDVALDLSGFIVPRTRIVISPQVGGIVSKVSLPREGEKVKTGDLLFEIDDTRYKAERLQAEASLESAQAQLRELQNGHEEEEKAHARALYEQAKVQETLAALEYDRARQLYPGSIGKAEFDKAWTTYRDAKAAVKVQKTNVDMVEHKTRDEKIAAARAEVKRCGAAAEKARYFHEKTKIVAPPDSEGTSRVFTVLQKNVNPGESVQADLVYTALCTLADLSEMEAEVDVQERDLHLIKVGTRCEIIPDAYPDRVYRGMLNRIQPLVNRQRGVVGVKVTIDKPDAFLLPDMNARVLFLQEADNSDAERDLPQIPTKALVQGENPAAVFVLDGGVARRRSVRLGTIKGDSVRVRDGLRPDDKVLLPGARPLRDGEPVRMLGK